VPWQPPFTLGQENAGWVAATGAGVTGVDDEDLRSPDAIDAARTHTTAPPLVELAPDLVHCFWTPYSEPSIEQLRQLRDALDSKAADCPSVLGIGDGAAGPRAVDRPPLRHLLWPTTVQIGPDRRGRRSRFRAGLRTQPLRGNPIASRARGE
jgi:hypothetical protein